jgi:hypothetical protein
LACVQPEILDAVDVCGEFSVGFLVVVLGWLFLNVGSSSPPVKGNPLQFRQLKSQRAPCHEYIPTRAEDKKVNVRG